VRVLVTGGLGFVGTNLVTGFLDGPDVRLRVLDNGSAGPPQPPLDDPRVEIRIADVRDRAAVDDAAASVDAIVHLAAQTGIVDSLSEPRSSVAINVEGTLNVLEAARRHGVRRVVCASSNAAVGRHEPPLDEDCLPQPISPYGATKLAAEALCCAFAEAYGLETVALRFSNVYGPWSVHKGSVVATFFRRVLRREPIVIHGSGDQTRDFLFTEDLTWAVRLAIERPVVGRVYQVASGRETAIRELARACQHIGEKDLGHPVAVEYRMARAGDVPRSYSSIARIGAELGFVPTISLDEGLRRTWAWFRAAGVAG
jgi:UDP-glucose 4-epimerase